MILNSGLEQQKTINPLSGSLYTFGFNYLAVGTGSTAPAATQTTLVAEVARGNAAGDGPAQTTVTSSSGSHVQIETQVSYKITFSGSYTLAEYGFFNVSSGGQALFRQLFRSDPANNASTPVTYTVNQYDSLTVNFTVIWRVDVSVTVTSGTLTHPGGNVTLSAGIICDATSTAAQIVALFHPYSTPVGSGAAFAATTTMPTTRTTSFTTSVASNAYSSDTALTVTRTAAASGTYQVTYKYTIAAGKLSLDNIGYMFFGNFSASGTTTISFTGQRGVLVLLSAQRHKTPSMSWDVQWTFSWAAV